MLPGALPRSRLIVKWSQIIRQKSQGLQGLLTFHSRIEISLQIRSIAVTTPAILRTCNTTINAHSQGRH